MIVLGITGGIGMGKSTSGDLLRQRNIPVIDTDVLAREVVEPGEPALAEIVSAFGRDVLDASGRLNRGEVARRVFGNPSLREKLESILLPLFGVAVVVVIWALFSATWAKDLPSPLRELVIITSRACRPPEEGVASTLRSTWSRTSAISSRAWPASPVP